VTWKSSANLPWSPSLTARTSTAYRIDKNAAEQEKRRLNNFINKKRMVILI
jgi:hypothetical protein